MNRTKLSLLVFTALAQLLAQAEPSPFQDFLDAIRARPEARHGATLFMACAACHGENGEGNAREGVPRIAGQFPRVIIRQLVDYRHGKRADPQMQRMADRHLLIDAQDMADVAAYAASRRAWTPAATGSGAHLARAAQLYENRCSDCHGVAGQGDGGSLIPRVAGQHYSYLLQQLQGVLEGQRPLLSFTHLPQLADLDRESLEGLADLLSRKDPSFAQVDTRRWRPGDGMVMQNLL